jgi:glycosyltransferase involved in cell wall biosynthesis
VGYDAEALQARHADRPDVVFDIRYVPDDEVPALLRSVSCVALPYRQLLTSGVAHLVMTYGVAMVAPDVPQFRDLVPVGGEGLLFRPGDDADMRRAVGMALDMTPEARVALARALVTQAQAIRPADISHRLGTVYDELAVSAGQTWWRSLMRPLRRQARRTP